MFDFRLSMLFISANAMFCNFNDISEFLLTSVAAYEIFEEGSLYKGGKP